VPKSPGATGSDPAIGWHHNSNKLGLARDASAYAGARLCVVRESVSKQRVSVAKERSMSMKKLALCLAVVAAACVSAQTGYAQNSRTFVSNTGAAGNTVQGCSASSPCDTFAHALSVTNSGGEINCLNAGEFGAVTITKSVTINCEGASNGGIAVNGDAVAITINTASILVNLIGLDINGQNLGGGNGVSITAAATVFIRNCKIYGFVRNGTFTGNAVLFEPGASGGALIVDNIFAANNYIGILENITSGSGNLTVRNSNISNNSVGIVAQVNGGTHAGATIEQTTLAFNYFGLETNGGTVLIGGSTIVNSQTGVLNAGGGTVYSFKNNQIGGNASDGTPLTVYPGGPLN
jgi:hypothetical protein